MPSPISLFDLVAPNKPMHWFPYKEIAGQKQSITLSTIALIRRNLADTAFPPIVSPEVSQQVSQKLLNALIQQRARQFPYGVRVKELSAEKRALFGYNKLVAAQYLTGDGDITLAFSRDVRTVAVINGSNHFELAHTLPGINGLSAARCVDRIAHACEYCAPFAKLPEVGYVCAEPELCGTGLSLCAVLFLPGIMLTDQINQLTNAAAELDFSVTYERDDKHFCSQICLLNANCAPEKSVADTALAFDDFLNRLEQHERDARRVLLKEPQFGKLEDVVCRTTAMVHGVRLMSPMEARSILEMLWAMDEIGVKELPVPKALLMEALVSYAFIDYLEKASLAKDDERERHAEIAITIRELFKK